jgi:hypothetical protein
MCARASQNKLKLMRELAQRLAGGCPIIISATWRDDARDARNG